MSHQAEFLASHSLTSSVLDVARRIHNSAVSRSKFGTQCSVMLTDRRFRQMVFSGRQLREFGKPLQQLVRDETLLDIVVSAVLQEGAQAIEITHFAPGKPCEVSLSILLLSGLWNEWAGAVGDAALEWMHWIVSRFPASGGELGWQHTTNRDSQYLLNPFLPAHPSPFVRGYRTIVYVPSRLVEVLGGHDRVLAEAPAETVRLVMRDGIEAGVVAQLTCDPRSLTSEQLDAWRTYLLPISTLAPDDKYPTGWHPDSRPLDVLQYDWQGPVDRSPDELGNERDTK